MFIHKSNEVKGFISTPAAPDTGPDPPQPPPRATCTTDLGMPSQDERFPEVPQGGSGLLTTVDWSFNYLKKMDLPKVNSCFR
jgi:hypothetical protein